MAYYTQVLLPDENILFVGRLHWFIYLRAWFLLALALLAVGGSDHLATMDGTDNPIRLVMLILALVFGLFGAISLILAWIRRGTTEMVVTDRRIIFKRGFIRRATVEMSLSKVETVDVNQSLTGRIFNYGTVLIRGSGTTYEPLTMVQDPVKLRTSVVTR